MPVSINVADRGDAVRPVVTADEPPLASLFAAAAADARALVGAEVELYKARLGERVTAYRGAATFFAVAGVLALAALIALLVGAILTLATLIGPGLATVAVVLASFVTAGVLALIGKGRLASPRADRGVSR